MKKLLLLVSIFCLSACNNSKTQPLAMVVKEGDGEPDGPHTSNEWKNKNLENIVTRMKGWQLETFKESYEYKIKEGVSIYKKNLLEKN